MKAWKMLLVLIAVLALIVLIGAPFVNEPFPQGSTTPSPAPTDTAPPTGGPEDGLFLLAAFEASVGKKIQNFNRAVLPPEIHGERQKPVEQYFRFIHTARRNQETRVHNELEFSTSGDFMIDSKFTRFKPFLPSVGSSGIQTQARPESPEQVVPMHFFDALEL